MQIPQLTKYILEELERGTSELEIKQKLFQTHWMPEEIEENYEYALAEAQKILGQYKTKKTRKKGKKTLILALLMLATALVFAIGLFIYIVITTIKKDTATSNSAPQPVSPLPTATSEPLIAVINQSDRKRDADRQTIQAALLKYYEDNDTYPTRLSQLEPGYLSPVPRDPESANPYKYERIIEGQDFKLCITYEEVGEVCFNRLSN